MSCHLEGARTGDKCLARDSLTRQHWSEKSSSETQQFQNRSEWLRDSAVPKTVWTKSSERQLGEDCRVLSESKMQCLAMGILSALQRVPLLDECTPSSLVFDDVLNGAKTVANCVLSIFSLLGIETPTHNASKNMRCNARSVDATD